MNFYEKPQFFLILSVFEELNFAGDHKVFIMTLFFPLFFVFLCF